MEVGIFTFGDLGTNPATGEMPQPPLPQAFLRSPPRDHEALYMNLGRSPA